MMTKDSAILEKLNWKMKTLLHRFDSISHTGQPFYETSDFIQVDKRKPLFCFFMHINLNSKKTSLSKSRMTKVQIQIHKKKKVNKRKKPKIITGINIVNPWLAELCTDYFEASRKWMPAQRPYTHLFQWIFSIITPLH